MRQLERYPTRHNRYEPQGATSTRAEAVQRIWSNITRQNSQQPIYTLRLIQQSQHSQAGTLSKAAFTPPFWACSLEAEPKMSMQSNRNLWGSSTSHDFKGRIQSPTEK